MANFAVSGISWGSETEYMANFLHRHVYNAFLHYPIMTINPACSLAILPMRVTLFPSGTLCVTNIPSIHGKDTLFCSELNGEHAGESFMSLQFIVEIC